MGTMDEELQILRTRAEEAVRLQSELKKVIANTDRVEALYQQEQASPKKKKLGLRCAVRNSRLYVG